VKLAQTNVSDLVPQTAIERGNLMQEPISWELKQRLIRSAQAERTRYMQAVFAAGFTFCWRRIRRLISIASLVDSNRRTAHGQAD
jgi:hypothetical protein